MANQRYVNLAKSSLASNYTVGNTTITLQTGDGTIFPSAGDFMIAVNDPPAFFLKCTAIAGDVLTVTSSGQEGTTAVNSPANTTITQVITAGALDAIRSNMSGIGTYANLPASGMKAGDRYKPTDSPIELIYDGSNWQAFAYGCLVTLPNEGSLAWINQGSASTVVAGSVFYKVPNAAGNNYRLRKKSLPAAPWTITVGIVPQLWPTQYSQGGIVLRESSSGKLWTFDVNNRNPAPNVLLVGKWNSPTSYNADASVGNCGIALNMIFLRIYDDAVNRHAQWSTDGINFIEFFSVGRTDFITPDEWGYGLDCNGQGDSAMNVMHMVQT